MRTRRLVLVPILVGGLLGGTGVTALACSPPFEPPSVRDLAADRVVLLGRTGERVEDGRAFHVERWFGPGTPAAQVVIAFKEGPAVGDCSYPVAAGQPLVIAPELEDGRFRADLVTLQADPSSEDGRRYLAEATERYGVGTAPASAHTADDGPSPLVVVGGAVLALLLSAGLASFVSGRRAR